MAGKARCRLHGGPSASGPAHPNWQHGMYSKVLPKGLSDHYAIARANPALTALTEQIAVVDAKIFELFEQLARGESPAAWTKVAELHGQLLEALAAFHAARKAANPIGLSMAMQQLEAITSQLGELAAHGASGAKAWAFVSSQIFLRKKLVDSEVKRQKIAHESLDRKRALAMLAYIAQSVARHVQDPKQKQAVVDDIRVLMRGTPQEAT